MHDPGSAAAHWSAVYRERELRELSWTRAHLDTSLRLLAAAGLDRDSRVVDVGGGASTLVDDLLEFGVARVAVLDLSSDALELARTRLGPRAYAVDWLVGDLGKLALPQAGYSHWHDRAVLHFLHAPDALRAYAAQAARCVAEGGHVVIGGFAPDGPERCSGLPVARRAAADVADILGPAFELLSETRETHHTPQGREQRFAWSLLRRRPG